LNGFAAAEVIWQGEDGLMQNLLTKMWCTQKDFWSWRISEPIPKGGGNFFEPRSSTICVELTELSLYWAQSVNCVWKYFTLNVCWIDVKSLSNVQTQ
jgi:hypothetical protein